MLKELEEALKRREEERRKVIEEAQKFANKLREVLGKVTVILYGSYARGDFNVWSDVDVIVISEKFRSVKPLSRYDMILELIPPKFEVKLWTLEEAKEQLSKPWWREALKHKIVIVDDYNLIQ